MATIKVIVVSEYFSSVDTSNTTIICFGPSMTLHRNYSSFYPHLFPPMQCSGINSSRGTNGQTGLIIISVIEVTFTATLPIIINNKSYEIINIFSICHTTSNAAISSIASSSS